jgi:hypothetical protein
MAKATMHATGTYAPVSWDEGQYAELDGAPSLTHARISYRYRGHLEGEGESEVLMYYRSGTSATYRGYERVNGRLGGRSDSFVLESAGTFEAGVARTTWKVVPGSGTGELTGLRGEGGDDAPAGGAEVPYRLDYDFD